MSHLLYASFELGHEWSDGIFQVKKQFITLLPRGNTVHYEYKNINTTPSARCSIRAYFVFESSSRVLRCSGTITVLPNSAPIAVDILLNYRNIGLFPCRLSKWVLFWAKNQKMVNVRGNVVTN
jgi:hypothetical protein